MRLAVGDRLSILWGSEQGPRLSAQVVAARPLPPDPVVVALRDLRSEVRALGRERAPQGADWLSVEEVASRLGRHVVTVRADLRSGRLPGVRVGRSWRVRAADLDALLGEKQRQQASRREHVKRIAAANEAQAARARAARAKRQGR